MHLKLKKRKEVIDFLNSGFSERDAPKNLVLEKVPYQELKIISKQSSIIKNYQMLSKNWKINWKQRQIWI